MRTKYRIKKIMYESGDTRYQIQFKLFFWWIDMAAEYWERLPFAQERLRLLEGNKIVSEEIV